jgi:flagellar hook-length control protein FliK
VADQVAGETARQAYLVRRGGTTDFFVRLEPPELGQVQVHLRATEQQLTARLVVADEAARQAIAGQLQDLRLKLQGAGITLGSFDVAHQRDGSRRSGQQQPPPRGSSVGKTSGSVGAVGSERLDVVV